MTTALDDPKDNEAAFEREYWRWKRRELVEEPGPEAFGLHPLIAEAIALRVHRQFEQKVVGKVLKSDLGSDLRSENGS